MLIGQDFEKIQFQPFGFDFVEPNALIGDTLIFIVAIYCAYKVKSLGLTTPFFKHWRSFFIVFGISFLAGGLGHFCFNYWGVPGKYFSWYFGILAPYFIEQAMLSLFDNEKWKKRLILTSKIKVIAALIATTLVFIFVDLDSDPSKGLRVTTVNTTVGLLFSLGYLGVRYARTIHKGFNYLWISVLILIPTAFFQSLKINIHQWFDRNDASHVLLIIGLLLYYACVKSYAESTRNR